MGEAVHVLPVELAVMLAFILFGCLYVFGVAWWVARGSKLLADWARSNGYEILRKQRRFLRKGPFSFPRAWGLPVFRVTLQDGQGRTRRAWVRCGSWWTGLLSSKVTVEWDE